MPLMNTEVVIPLDKLTFDEKMEIVHTVWDDILKQPEKIDWPEWHKRELEKIQEEIDNGTAEFIDFETAKKMLLEEKL